jgi:cytochrome b561
MLRGSSSPSKGNPSPRSRYPNSTILLYWLVLLLVVATYACSLLRENVERGSDLREGLKAWRFMLGLTVLAATFLCASLRVFIWKTPPITPDPPRLLHWLSIAARLATYLWLVAMPLAGWTILNAEGDAIPLWGLNLPPLTGVNKQLAEQVQKLHETGGTVGYFLLGLHAAAALFHHYTLRDNTRRRMLPGQGR